MSLELAPSASSGCFFGGEYHDLVWGTPVTNTSDLFAQLSLCTQQAGVSWRVVWNKRHEYRAAFKDWDMWAVAAMTERDLDLLCDKEGPWKGRLMQNRNKLFAIIHNARQCCKIEEQVPGGLVGFLWGIVGNTSSQPSPYCVSIDGLDTPLECDPKSINSDAARSSAQWAEIFDETGIYSDELSSRLKRVGEHKDSEPAFEPFKFIGSITLQAFMLQCGLLNGHSPHCCKNPRSSFYSAGAVGSRTPTTRGRKSDDDPPEAPHTERSTKRRRAAPSDDVWL